MCIKMLNMFQRAEVIHKMQAGFSLEYQNMHARYIFNINILFSLHTIFKKHTVSSHSCVMVCAK